MIRRLPVDLKALDVLALITMAEAIANRISDGHLSILRTTTGWKVAFEPPIGLDHNLLEYIRPAKTLRAALVDAIKAQLETER